ncbi:methylaspartate mutase sigma subunit [Kribbella sp. VKM Ac-2569]|uniref:cobalamin B12-binding domain-containing protein n=1 Tax=Kribbella sp. VKM Ac-2569 TaxID=2512220 RepID=UPI00102AE5A7|nr:cobalamin-dependent protein [Kribbella sp. VKM Ac-2569]RZT16777.1 methylaspartate mutase sigma subunit [Kribbella sp. VKM Ac-2569]
MDHAAGKEVSADGLSVVLTSVSSDSHTWNLVVLQLVLEELGHQVHNLGACVPDELMVSKCLRLRPDLIVVSSVNGHGFHDGLRLIRQVRSHAELVGTPMVIGGKLGIAGPGCDRSRAQLTAAGYGAVFEDGTGLAAFQSYIGRLAIGQAS